MPEASQDSSLKPIVLVVVLAAAVLVGILVLAHFSSARNPSPPSLPNRSQAADPAQTLANVSTDGHEVRLADDLPPSEPPAARNASSLTNDAAAPSAAKPAKTAVSARRTASKRWMPARTSKAKRKSRRSPRYGSIYFSDKR
jgi:cytoskeletal protein RodZ